MPARLREVPHDQSNVARGDGRTRLVRIVRLVQSAVSVPVQGVVLAAVRRVFVGQNLGLFLRRLQGAKVGQGVFIDRSVILDGIYPELITIGDDARLAPRCVVYCHSKAGRVLASGPLPDVVAPVTIGPSAFVGLGVIIMPGVTVGRGAVLVSGAVVFGSVPDFSVASGNPARVIRQLTPPEEEKDSVSGTV